MKKFLTAVKHEAESITSLKALEDEVKAINTSRDIIVDWETTKRAWDEDLIAASRAPSSSHAAQPLPPVSRCPYEAVETNGT